MKHTYQVTGMTCANCEATVKSSLLTLPDVSAADVSKDKGTAVVTMNKHIALRDLQAAIGENGKYHILSVNHNEAVEPSKSWVETYKPILVIFVYITTATLAVQVSGRHFDFMQWMQHFMAGFFLIFSFFKMLDLKGFAESYSMYDVIAKRFKAWGFVYAFIEMGLGFAYLINFNPLITNIITATVMSISIIGVLQSVLNKQKIQCACLGAVFKLPMSTVTIIEDALMIVMSGTVIIIIILSR